MNTYKEWTNKEGKKIAFAKTWIQIFQSSPENLLTISEEFLEKVVKLLAISKDIQVYINASKKKDFLKMSREEK